MVELSISTANTGLYEPLTYITIFAVFAVCTAYLIRHYFENREKLTWLFIAYFAVISACFFVSSLIVMDVLNFSLGLAIGYTFLIGSAITATIGIVMLGAKQLYTLPLFVVIVAFFHSTLLESNYVQLINSIQTFSYLSTMQFIGSPLYIALQIMFPNFAPLGQQLGTTLLNLQLNPLSVLIPNTASLIIVPYNSAIAIPTIILFYYLAWTNRSGKSLGFAFGLTTNLILGLMVSVLIIGVRSIDVMVLYLIGAVFYASGIFGVFDRLMKKKETPTRNATVRNVKKEKG
ncbi:MAG: hypothetical protein WED07_03725 [Candidatus Freyarchaeum deiterrae]